MYRAAAGQRQSVCEIGLQGRGPYCSLCLADFPAPPLVAPRCYPPTHCFTLPARGGSEGMPLVRRQAKGIAVRLFVGRGDKPDLSQGHQQVSYRHVGPLVVKESSERDQFLPPFPSGSSRSTAWLWSMPSFCLPACNQCSRRVFTRIRKNQRVSCRSSMPNLWGTQACRPVALRSIRPPAMRSHDAQRHHAEHLPLSGPRFPVALLR